MVARAGLPIDEPPKVNRGDGDTQPQPSDEQSKEKDTDGQKGFGGFKDVVSCWAMLLARIYDVFPLGLSPVRWVDADLEFCNRDSIGREDTDAHP